MLKWWIRYFEIAFNALDQATVRGSAAHKADAIRAVACIRIVRPHSLRLP